MKPQKIIVIEYDNGVIVRYLIEGLAIILQIYDRECKKFRQSLTSFHESFEQAVELVEAQLVYGKEVTEHYE